MWTGNRLSCKTQARLAIIRSVISGSTVKLDLLTYRVLQRASFHHWRGYWIDFEWECPEYLELPQWLVYLLFRLERRIGGAEQQLGILVVLVWQIKAQKRIFRWFETDSALDTASLTFRLNWDMRPSSFPTANCSFFRRVSKSDGVTEVRAFNFSENIFIERGPWMQQYERSTRSRLMDYMFH